MPGGSEKIYEHYGSRDRGVKLAHKIILTTTNELENKVKLVVSLEELDHMQNIWRLAALMVHFDFAKDLNSKSQLELFRKSSKRRLRSYNYG